MMRTFTEASLWHQAVGRDPDSQPEAAPAVRTRAELAADPPGSLGETGEARAGRRRL